MCFIDKVFKLCHVLFSTVISSCHLVPIDGDLETNIRTIDNHFKLLNDLVSNKNSSGLKVLFVFLKIIIASKDVPASL